MFQHSSTSQVLLALMPGRLMRLVDVQRRMLATRGRTFTDITVRQALGHLVKAGKILRVEAGLYILAGHKVQDFPLREFTFKKLSPRLGVNAADLKRDYREMHGRSFPADVFVRELEQLYADGYAMPAPRHPGFYLSTGKRLDEEVFAD